jgi:hypothetical protein
MGTIHSRHLSGNSPNVILLFPQWQKTIDATNSKLLKPRYYSNGYWLSILKGGRAEDGCLASQPPMGVFVVGGGFLCYGRLV